MGELFKVCLTTIAGIGALIALYYSAKRVQAMEKGNVDTRFNNAVGHLGSKNSTVVLGGIHALHQIAVKHKSYRQVVHNLFCSYLRENSANLYDKKTPDKCPIIIQTLIDYLFKFYNNKNSVYKGYRSNLSFCTFKNCNFNETEINDVNFCNSTFEKCHFLLTTLTDCAYIGGTLTDCNFNNGILINCSFCFVKLTDCFFGDGTLSGCDFTFGTLTKCKFIDNYSKTKTAELFNCNFETAEIIDTELPENRIYKI